MGNSPFAGGQGWELKLRMLPKKWDGVGKILDGSSDKERDIKIAKYLNSCMFLTAAQIIQTPIWQSSTGIDKKQFNLLARGGYLVKHQIINKGSLLPFYSAGPIAFVQDVSAGYKLNFYRSFGLTTVLKILSVNQFFLRLVKFAYVRINYNVLPPYTAEVHYIEKRHGPYLENKDKEKILKIISLRNYQSDITEMKRQLPRVDEKAILIGHNAVALELILDSAKDNENLRYTYDELLFKEKLADAFLKYDKGSGKLERTYIENFA